MSPPCTVVSSVRLSSGSMANATALPIRLRCLNQGVNLVDWDRRRAAIDAEPPQPHRPYAPCTERLPNRLDQGMRLKLQQRVGDFGCVLFRPAMPAGSRPGIRSALTRASVPIRE